MQWYLNSLQDCLSAWPPMDHDGRRSIMEADRDKVAPICQAG